MRRRQAGAAKVLCWLMNLGFAGGSAAIVTPTMVIGFTLAIEETFTFQASIRQSTTWPATIVQTLAIPEQE
jgi:hypothetical protein